MVDRSALLNSLTGIHERIRADVERETGNPMNRVWCRSCGRGPVPVENGLRDGWPKCCGFTMTIDPPETWCPNDGADRPMQGVSTVDINDKDFLS